LFENGCFGAEAIGFLQQGIKLFKGVEPLLERDRFFSFGASASLGMLTWRFRIVGHVYMELLHWWLCLLGEGEGKVNKRK
jgi:hypothetical protein